MRRWVEWLDTSNHYRTGLFVRDLTANSVIVESFVHGLGARELVVSTDRIGLAAGLSVLPRETREAA